jgi:sulfite reductase (NADPH) hemoprotein beta-component
MYRYDNIDRSIVAARVAQFRDQTRRYLAGKLTDDDFRPLRLQNGLYVEKNGPMLRIAIPYGQINAAQLEKLAHVTRRYDRGIGHFTTRQNIQLNWVQLPEVPELLAELAEVDMHAIQTSGSVIRNVTTDQYAGVADDEIADPRPWAEIIRQWSTLHPEFAFLPRKFKIAVSGSTEDRAAIRVHDVGLQLAKRDGGIGFQVFVGGGLGRTPLIGEETKDFLPWQHLLTYLEAVLQIGRAHV